MQAIQMIQSIPRYAATKVIGALYRPIFWSRLAMLRYSDVPEPKLPGPDWVKVKTRYGGICGSDLHTLMLKDSPMLSALVSFPFVLGHENVGTIAEVGPQVQGFTLGERVVVEPLLGCVVRGIAEPCEYCLRGETSRCENFSAGKLSAGIGLGSCRDTGGSWGEYYVAHQSQLFRVPHTVTDENALMVEPFSVALHAVLRSLPADHETVVIMGAGVIGLCTLAALRACGSRARAIVVARYPFQAQMAQRLGADEVIVGRQTNVLEAIARATNSKLLKPILGKPLFVGGADVVYECVGSDASLDDSLRLARSGGRIVLLGLAAVPKGVDWTPIWLNELTIEGAFWTGLETFRGRRVRGFELTLEWMAEGKLDLTPLVTHRFQLREYKKALEITLARGRHGVIKSVFIFDSK